MLAPGPLRVDQGGVAAVGEMPGGEQAPVLQPGVDAGQGQRAGAGGGHGGDVGDDVGAVIGAGLGHVREVSGPAGDLAPAGVAGGQVAGRDDAGGRRRQAAAVVIVAPAQAAGGVPVVVLDHDLPQGLHLGAVQQARKTGCQVLQQQPGVRPGVVHPGFRPGGVLAQADRPAVAAAPLVIDQAFQHIAGGAGDLFQSRAHRLGDQLQAGQVPHGRQDVGGAGALGGALADQPGLLQPGQGQGQVKEPVRPPVLQQALAEVAQHAVMEAGIVEIEAERVLEVDPAPHGLSSTAVREIEQELQHAHRGQLRRRESRTPVPGIPPGEVLVLPQAVEPVPHPHRRRPGRVADRATRAVSSGTSTPRRGRIDITHSSGISQDSHIPARLAHRHGHRQPNASIPDRVKLRRESASLWPMPASA